MWRTIFLPLLVALPVLAIGPLPAAAQGGVDDGPISVTPDAGGLDTTVVLEAEWWSANGDVEIYAGYTASLYARPASFVGPVATTRASSQRHWRVELQPGEIDGLAVPDGPGFLWFRAASSDFETSASFALIADGDRPAGAGEVRLTVSIASGIADESFDVAIKRSTETEFNGWPASANAIAPYEETYRRLEDGDWDILVLPKGNREVIGLGAFETTRAKVCSYPLTQIASYCDNAEDLWRSVTVKRVSIRDGQVADVEIVLGGPEDAEASAGAGGDRLRTVLLASTAGAAAAVLLLGGLAGVAVGRSRQ